jgi:hypothetical protein
MRFSRSRQAKPARGARTTVMIATRVASPTCTAAAVRTTTAPASIHLFTGPPPEGHHHPHSSLPAVSTGVRGHALKDCLVNDDARLGLLAVLVLAVVVTLVVLGIALF